MFRAVLFRLYTFISEEETTWDRWGLYFSFSVAVMKHHTQDKMQEEEFIKLMVSEV